MVSRLKRKPVAAARSRVRPRRSRMDPDVEVLILNLAGVRDSVFWKSPGTKSRMPM